MASKTIKEITREYAEKPTVTTGHDPSPIRRIRYAQTERGPRAKSSSKSSWILPVHPNPSPEVGRNVLNSTVADENVLIPHILAVHVLGSRSGDATKMQVTKKHL